MDRSELAKAIDWTPSFANQLLPTDAELEKWCETAVERGIGQLFVTPMFARKALARLKGTGVKVVGPVGGVILGHDTICTRLSLVSPLISLGYDELDTLMNLYAFAGKRFTEVESEIQALVRLAKDTKPDIVVKVIVETSFWSEAQLKDAAKLVAHAGADFVKTCTGIGSRGVSERDVELIREAVAGTPAQIKASGGISTGKQAARLLGLGATRLGASNALRILDTL